MAEADESGRAAMLAGLHYTGMLNRAFAAVYVVFSAIAIVLWSVAALSGRELPRGLALYGLVLGLGLLAGGVTGHLRLGIRGFGSVVLGQALWMGWAATELWRSPRRAA